MGSRFENFDLGRAIAGILGMKDPKNAPTSFNTDELQSVIEVGRLQDVETYMQGSWNGGLATFNNGSIDLVGTIGTGATTIPGGGLLAAAAQDRDVRLLNMNVQVSYNVAGGAADAGVVSSVLVAMSAPGVGLSFPIYDEFGVAAATPNLTPQWNYPQGAIVRNAPAQRALQGGQWDGLIPRGFSCEVVVSRVGGGVYPVSTSTTGTFLLAIGPKGVRRWHG